MKTKFGFIGFIFALISLFFVQQPAHAGWVVKNGLAVDVVQTCRDGGYVGLATFNLPLDVAINIINHDTGGYLFGGIFHPPANYVPEINFQNSAYYEITWQTGELLPVGTVVDYHPTNPELGVVEDCLLDEPAPPIVYDGDLTNAMGKVEGHYDFTFFLYDSPEGGDLMADSVVIEHVVVREGMYEVALNFGEAPFEADLAIWLEIWVKEPGGEAFKLLPEREPFG